MKLPTEIAAIIAASGSRKLSVSEKKKIVHWYRMLNSNIDPQISEEEEKEREKRVFEMIMDYINKHSGP